MTQPLRSTPITVPSSLLQVGPPACLATVLNPLRFQPLGTLPPAHLHKVGCVETRLLPFHAKAADQARVVYMPDPAWPVSGPPPDSSRNTPHAPVSMSPVSVTTLHQRFACARLPDPYLTHTCAFSSSLTTTVFSQRSMRRFDASPRRATPKGHNLHLPRSTTSRSSAYTIKLLSMFGTHVGFQKSACAADLGDRCVRLAGHDLEPCRFVCST